MLRLTRVVKLLYLCSCFRRFPVRNTLSAGRLATLSRSTSHVQRKIVRRKRARLACSPSVNRNRDFGSLAGRISPVRRTIKIKNSQASFSFSLSYVLPVCPFRRREGLRGTRAAIREHLPVPERQKVLSSGAREIMIYLRTVISYIYRAGIQAGVLRYTRCCVAAMA